MTYIENTKLFWVIDQDARIALMKYQWTHYGTKLDIPPMPKQQGHNPELEPEVDPELVRDMQKPPHSPRRIDGI